jgi:DNA-binding beta-propeller fold protein YncE
MKSRSTKRTILLLSVVLAQSTASVEFAAAQSPRNALEVRLSSPSHIAIDGEGRALIADTGNRQIRRLESDGTLVTVVGAGIAESPGARLVRPTGVAATPEGEIIIADPGAQRVWWAQPGGPILPLAGTGRAGFSGDGGPAPLAQLSEPVAVAVVPGSAIFIADRGNDRVRRITPDGTIRTVAGSGAPEPSTFRTPVGPSDLANNPDFGGPARRVALSQPSGITATPDGGFVVADTGNAIVRRFFFGTMTTIAGTGNPGVTAEEGTARRSDLAAPAGVAIASDGELLFADQHNQRVTGVRPNGRLETIAGTGEIGTIEGPTPAREARLAWPTGVAALPGGEALVADTNAHAVLKLSADGSLARVAGAPRKAAEDPPTATVATRTAYLTRRNYRVRRGCRLPAKYNTTVNGKGHFWRGDNRQVWNGQIKLTGGRFKTRPVRLRRGTHIVYFWASYGPGKDLTSAGEYKLRVRRRGKCG